MVGIDQIHSIEFNELNAYIREVSYGLAWTTGDVTDRWYQVRTPLSRLDIERCSYNEGDMTYFVEEVIKAADNEVGCRSYNYIVILPAGEVWPNTNGEIKVHTNDGQHALTGFAINKAEYIGL